jgi:hypothetical protein
VLLALLSTFAASRKEPLATALEREHAAIVAGGFGEPQIQFVMSDASVVRTVPSVARVLKRFPQLEQFAQDLAPYPGGPETGVITNRISSGPTDTVDFATLLEIARGVPKSFPFNNVGLHFSVPAFTAATAPPSIQGGQIPGIDVKDFWWLNGRQRSITALTIVDADPSAKKLPQPPPEVAALLASCGRPAPDWYRPESSISERIG